MARSARYDEARTSSPRRSRIRRGCGCFRHPSAWRGQVAAVRAPLRCVASQLANMARRVQGRQQGRRGHRPSKLRGRSDAKERSLRSGSSHLHRHRWRSTVSSRARLAGQSFRAQTICVDLRMNVDGGDARGGWRRETEIGYDHKSARLTNPCGKT